jgi:hypothetical protein
MYKSYLLSILLVLSSIAFIVHEITKTTDYSTNGQLVIGQKSVPELIVGQFDTIQEAGVYALQNAYNQSNAYEYGGIILETSEHKFLISAPTTKYSGDSTEIDHTNTHFKTWIVADYHTHPCLPYTHITSLFSEPDLASNMYLNIIGFIGDLCTGKVHEFDPSKDKPDDVTVTWPSGHVESLTDGHIIGLFSMTRPQIIMEEKPTEEIQLTLTKE